MIPEEWNEAIIQDLEFLKKAGLIDIVGINEDGDWLYGLTPATKIVMDEVQSSDDPFSTISALLEVADGIARAKETEEGLN